MMNKYLYCFLTVLMCGSFAAKAQVKFLNDLQGRPIMEQAYTNVEGRAYLSSNWVAASVSFVNGKTVNIKIKYDLVKDELLFQNKSDSVAMGFVEPVKGFNFTSPVLEASNILSPAFSSGYPPVDAQTASSFYQVVADGKVKLLKHYKKIIRTAFNSASSTQSFVQSDVYYVFIDNQITRIKPSQKTILAVLNDKAGQLQTYMKTNAIDYKNDAALAKLFEYYNSL